ncbi:MAG TPA: GGDEF domain-containing protein [Archangium sp.]|uniref:GGDEF domain-containing protein n=1 Tax=Archangium sp. TaxID=1872627 RepID=UPI002E3094E9|nr:GGDEF domain-containing protein [Archangium sp.]HEX5745252.1 GGDEF domain-containing protein [Archangium sp.]
MTERAPQVCPSTGAYLRPYFESLLAKAVSDATLARMPLTVLWVDVDETQEGNDAHGREAMDAALSGLVDELAAELDGRGPIGRMEGDAFAASLYAVAPHMSVRLAEGLRRRLADRRFRSQTGGFQLTVSVGIAGLRPGEPYGNLLEAAEASCVQAKQAGRNRVVVR